MSYFTVIEGPDGSGKTTVCRLVNQKLLEAGVACRQVREPGGTEFGEALRDILLHDRRSLKVPVVCHSMLLGSMSFANACADIPNSAVYLSDRWAPISSSAYQITMAKDEEEAQLVTNFWRQYMELLVSSARARRPDLFVYLRTDEATAHARSVSRSKPDNMDPQDLDLVRRRIAVYDSMFSGGTLWDRPVLTFDSTNRSAEDIAEHVVDQIIARSSSSDTPPDGVNVIQL